MQMMNDVLHLLIDYFVTVYLNGILILKNSKQENILQVTQVLEKVERNQLITTYLKNYELEKESFNFLKHITSRGELTMDLEKTIAINQ